MPNNLTEKQKQQASLFISNALSIAAKREFEKELKSNLTLKTYVDELSNTVETTREFSTLKPSDELLQGNRNLLKGKLQQLENEKANGSVIQLLEKAKNGVASIFKVRQPVWAIITYVVIGLVAGRLFLGSSGDKPLDLNGDGNLDINKIISSGLLSDLDIDQSALSPSSVNFVSNVDDRFNVSGDVEDQDIRKILYYLLLNDENKDNRLEAGKLINKMAPNNETQMVLISSVLSESDSQVKLQSIRTLGNYQINNEIVDACKRVLLDERNSKVRLEALEILENSKSSDLIPLLEVVSKMDDDYSVRNRAGRLLNDLQKPVAIESTEAVQ